MARISFHQKLETLRERLLPHMAGVAEQTLRLALDAHCRAELAQQAAGTKEGGKLGGRVTWAPLVGRHLLKSQP